MDSLYAICKGEEGGGGGGGVEGWGGGEVKGWKGGADFITDPIYDTDIWFLPTLPQ